MPVSDGRSVSPARRSRSKACAQSGTEIVGTGTVRVADCTWVRVLDVEDVGIDLGPAAPDRARRDVREVVLEPAGEPVVDERSHLLGEGC